MYLSERIKSRDNNFNLIRFAAASFVFIQHSFDLNHFPKPWLVNVTVGQAVPIFITISGFLVAQSWSGNPRLLVFLKKRFLRIFPALFCSTVFAAFLIGPLVTSLPLRSYFAQPITFSYLANVFLFPIHYVLPGVFTDNPYPFAVNGSIWSLPIEVFLYGILAVLGLVGILRKRYLIAGLLLLLIGVEALYGNIISGLPLIFRTMPPGNLLNLSIFFFIGCIYYLFSSKIMLSKMLALIALGIFYISSRFPVGNIASYLLLPYITIQFAYMDLPTKRLFEKNDISYGLYIYAFPIQQTAIHFFNDVLVSYILFPVAFCVLLICSYLSWRFVEQPCLRLKHRQFFKPAPVQVGRNESCPCGSGKKFKNCCT